MQCGRAESPEWGNTAAPTDVAGIMGRDGDTRPRPGAARQRGGLAIVAGICDDSAHQADGLELALAAVVVAYPMASERGTDHG